MPSPVARVLRFSFGLILLTCSNAAFAESPKLPENNPQIRRLYDEELKLVRAAWLAIPLNDPHISDPNILERPEFSPGPVADGKSNSKDSVKQIEPSRRYDFEKDPNWKDRCLKAENAFKTLIQQYRKKEGQNSKSAAILSDHLATLYAYSGNGDRASLERDVHRLLFPPCPKGHSNSDVAQLSPPPNQIIDEQLRTGWWQCRRCGTSFQIQQKKHVRKT